MSLVSGLAATNDPPRLNKQGSHIYFLDGERFTAHKDLEVQLLRETDSSSRLWVDNEKAPQAVAARDCDEIAAMTSLGDDEPFVRPGWLFEYLYRFDPFGEAASGWRLCFSIEMKPEYDSDGFLASSYCIPSQGLAVGGLVPLVQYDARSAWATVAILPEGGPHVTIPIFGDASVALCPAVQSDLSVSLVGCSPDRTCTLDLVQFLMYRSS